VRGGSPDSRFVVCADGSPSSLRIFPLLQKLLPAVKGPVDLIYARRPDDPKAESDKAQHCLNQAYQWLTRCGKQVRVLQPQGNKRFELILAAAGCDSVIVMGESHMHDIRRRTLGTLGIKVLSRTDSSFLMVKLANEPSPFACAAHHDDGLLP
jgi:nucleotide-binding universal stress UspA family protein